MDNTWRLLIDLAIILTLIAGVWRFNAIQTARSGNILAALALLSALGIVFFGNPLQEPAMVVLALAAGGTLGGLVAARANMIQIPAMVAFQHGAGGIAAFLTASAELTRDQGQLLAVAQLSGVLGVVIGAATFGGSMVASAKLAGVARQSPVVLPGHGRILVSLLACISALAILAALVSGPPLLSTLLGLILLSIALGVIFAMRIGGADMPVLISFLNATAGLAASFCGIIIENRLLIACGATVAASGSILTHVMCQAMNRRLLGVLVGSDLQFLSGGASSYGSPAVPAPIPDAAEPPVSPDCPPHEIRRLSPLARAIEALQSAGKVIIIPGYGMALAHAQFEVAKLAQRLTRLGKEVRFAIHPIAGRMPGHMHVLLAEADVDPDTLFDLREINAEFSATDVALVVGACDVVNPAAIYVKGTPISGMPILAAHEAKQVVVCNMDDRPGYSGVENPLYSEPKTILVLGDAKATFERLRAALDSGGDR